MRNRFRWALVVAAVLLFAAVASAQDSRVVLVEPQQKDAVIFAAFMRLQGELAASGFQVLVVREADAGTTPKMLADIARDQGAFASISIVRAGESTSADVWINDRITGKTSIRTIATRRPDAPELLAVRAADLLRVSLQEYASEPPPADVVSIDPSLESTPDIERWSRGGNSQRTRWELLAGGQFLGSFSELGLGAGPMIGLGVQPTQRWLFRVTFFGPTPTPAWRAPQGVVRLRQELVGAFAGWAPIAGNAGAIHLLAGGGVYHLNAVGEAEAPLESRSDSVLTPAFMPGVLGSWSITDATSLNLLVHGIIPTQRPGVQMGEVVERHQVIMVMGGLGLGVSL